MPFEKRPSILFWPQHVNGYHQYMVDIIYITFGDLPGSLTSSLFWFNSRNIAYKLGQDHACWWQDSGGCCIIIWYFLKDMQQAHSFVFSFDFIHIIMITMGRNGIWLTSVATSCDDRLAVYQHASQWDFLLAFHFAVYALLLCAFLNSDSLGEYSRVSNKCRIKASLNEKR